MKAHFSHVFEYTGNNRRVGLVSALVQQENLYGQKGNSSRWTVLVPEVWESNQKKHQATLCGKQMPRGEKAPWVLICRPDKIQQSTERVYDKIFIKSRIIYLHFSIISHKHLLPFPCGFNLFWCSISFINSALPPSLLLLTLWGTHRGNTTGGNGCLYRAVKNHSKCEDI